MANMRLPRTAKQRQILNIMQAFIEQNGYVPSYSDLAYAVGVRSRATIAKHLSSMARQGVVIKEWKSGTFFLRPATDADPIQSEPMIISRKPAIPRDLRWEVMERDNFTCQHCGFRRFLEIDHIVAFSKGGETVTSNLQTLCGKCNMKKGAS